MKTKILKPLILWVLSCAIPIGFTSINSNAATIDQSTVDNKGTTPITANVSEAYTVTIPDSFNFGTIARGTGLTYTSAGTISASDVTIASTKTLNVKIDSSTVFEITNNTDTIAYDIYNSNSSTTPVTHDTALLSALSGASPSSDYYLGLDKANVNNPGSYTGSIVFVVSIDNTNP